MSFVGPRPEVPRYVETQDLGWREILSVRPGLTDPATLRFRDEEVLMASISSDRERYYREVVLSAKLEASIAYLHERT
jgi:lipopolysaccharide/colanic/teichoic acid biosynthesis glycosyltransferase